MQFGKLPTGVKPEDAELPSYENLTKPRPLPNSKEALIEFLGVTVSHKGTQYSAAFALEGEVILHGTGTCRPSAAQCKVLDIKEKETEQLEYLTSTGELATWELRVVSITSSKASSAAVGSMLHAQAHTAKRDAPLGGAHVLNDAGMRYSRAIRADRARRPPGVRPRRLAPPPLVAGTPPPAATAGREGEHIS